jgi:hypothetical protein
MREGLAGEICRAEEMWIDRPCAEELTCNMDGNEGTCGEPR